MKNIGEKLKLTREEAGLTLEEVSEDLKIDLKKLQLLELGNKESFKDIYDLKYYIRDYAKYLGLDFEKLIEEFNEFVFDYTSRIPIAQIEKASMEISKDNKKIVSPYTIEHKKSNSKMIITVCLFIVLISLTIGLVIFNNNTKNDNANIAALI